MIRSLFAKRPSPYYIVAPDYRRTSAGIRVMHMLCDALKRSGYEAYITTDVVAPGLMTPRLTDDVRIMYQSLGVEPIVVYPEVVDGNPLAGNVVARYILNHPGFFGEISAFEETDILFSYTRGLLQPGMRDDRVMYMPAVDTSIFCLPADSTTRIPGKVCYYQGRAGQALVAPALLAADSVEITLGSPGSWEELAALFQSCEYFYCTEATGMAAEAVLCGCIAVILPNQYAPQPLSQHENNNYGAAWGNTPENIQRARETLPLLRESLMKHRQAFWKSLDHFIEVTQRAAEQYTRLLPEPGAQHWLESRTLSPVQRQLLGRHLQGCTLPVLGIVVLDLDGDVQKLEQTLANLAGLQACGVILRPLIMTVAEHDRVGLSLFRFDAADPVNAINEVVSACACDVFTLINSGEVFTAAGLMSVAQALVGIQSCRALYADEAMRFADGNIELLMRPGLNLDLLLSFPASMARHWLFNRETWQRLGGFATWCPQAFELEFILRLIENAAFEGLSHVSEPLIIGDALIMQDSLQQRQAIEQHLRNRGFDGAQVGSSGPGCYTLDYGHAKAPSVSIVLAVNDQLAYAQRCVETLLENTTYNNYEVLLLDGGSQDTSVISWLHGIEQLSSKLLRVARFPAELSVETMYNQAANQSVSEFLLFLDSRVGVTGADWLQQMLNHAMRPEVGCVGAKLVASDGKISHAGLLLGQQEVVSNCFKGLPANDPGHANRLQVDQNYTALAAECLMLRRELFVAVGGFDEQMQPWANVDLCLKLHQAGYLNVWTPRVQLLISEVEAPPVSLEQEDRLYERWLPTLARDQAASLNLCAVSEGIFCFADSDLSWRPLSALKALPTVLAYPSKAADGSFYRIKAPFYALREQGQLEGVLSSRMLSPVELERYAPDVIVLNRQVDNVDIEAMRRMKAFSSAFKVYDLDTYLPHLGLTDPYRKRAPGDVLASLQRGLSYMDRLLVPSAFMAQVFDGFCAEIRVLENRLVPRSWASVQGMRRQGEKPRVGWVGTVGNASELEVIAEVIKALASEVHWVMFGACPAHLRDFVHEFHETVGMEQYPAKLASLNLDLAVVPLDNSLFNRCKSNLRLLELGACGVPVICSDVEPYQGLLPVKRVDNRFEAWMDALRAHLADLDAAAALGDYLQSCVRRDWMLDNCALTDWHDSWLVR